MKTTSILAVCALCAGLSSIGCEEKQAPAPKAPAASGTTTGDAAKAASDAMNKGADAAKQAADKGAQAVKDTTTKAADAAAAFTAEMKDKSLADLTAQFNTVKQQAEDLYAKANASPLLKPVVDNVKSQVSSAAAKLAELKGVDLSSWKAKADEFTKSLDTLKTAVSDLSSKIK